MTRRPSFQFYPADWRNDVALRMCSAGARGLWMDILCLMHEGSPYGYLTYNGKDILPDVLARILGESGRDVELWLQELEDHKVLKRSDTGSLYSKRMVRDEEIRQVRAAGGVRSLAHPNVPKRKDPKKDRRKDTLPGSFGGSPSSSSSSSLIHPIDSEGGEARPEYPPEFEALWAAYPKRLGGSGKVATWKQVQRRLKDGYTWEQLEQGAARYAALVRAQGAEGTTYVKQAQTFFGPNRHFEDGMEIPDASGGDGLIRDPGIITW